MDCCKEKVVLTVINFGLVEVVTISQKHIMKSTACVIKSVLSNASASSVFLEFKNVNTNQQQVQRQKFYIGECCVKNHLYLKILGATWFMLGFFIFVALSIWFLKLENKFITALEYKIN